MHHAAQAWVAAKRTRDFDEADRIREAMLAAGTRAPVESKAGPVWPMDVHPVRRPKRLVGRGWPRRAEAGRGWA
jgi:hypothetical protein